MQSSEERWMDGWIAGGHKAGDVMMVGKTEIRKLKQPWLMILQLTKLATSLGQTGDPT